MRINIINHLVCPKCRADLLLSVCKQTNERIIDGELKCNKCHKKFSIENGIPCFVASDNKSDSKNSEKLRKLTIKQEIPKKWLQLYPEDEKRALKREWKWMLSSVKQGADNVHLDFATGTGRFLRNIVPATKGEIVALERDYATCVELQYFLEKIKRNKRVSIICADALNMPFKDGVFDSVSSWYGIEELKLKNIIKEAERVVKKGRFVTVSASHYPKGSKSFLLAKKHRVRLITKEEMFKAFKDSGFRKVEQEIFFEGYGRKEDFPIPVLNDFYLIYAIKGRK